VNGDGYILPQKGATVGKWYDWVILHAYEGDTLIPAEYPGFVIDFDAESENTNNIK
jgi:hypothetical protein